jgi:putative ABC transport system permease protein
MNRQLAVRNVARSLTRFKVRALLGGFGIVVSVLATVFVLSVSGAVRTTFETFVMKLYPGDVVTLSSGASFMGGGSGAQSLRVRDVEAVATGVPGIVAWDITAYSGRRDVRAGSQSGRVNVIGTGASAPAVRRRGVSEGAYFDDADVDSRARVALIGTTAQRVLFGGASAIGATLYVDNMPFQVKGVLESFGVSPHGDDQDDLIAVPYTLAMESLSKVDYVRQAAFLVDDRSRVEAVGQQVAQVMRRQHAIIDGRSDDFSVIVPRQMQELVVRNFGMMNLFVAMICAACFLVSALVVLGVMNVSVRQRLPEIGLRKAVGAAASDVRAQVLWEALLIAGAACVVGALLAWIAVAVVGPWLTVKFGIGRSSVSLAALGVGLAAAFATGLIGALWPAHRAAKLDAVEALRSR